MTSPSWCLGVPHSLIGGTKQKGSKADIKREMNVGFVTFVEVEIWKFAGSCLKI